MRRISTILLGIAWITSMIVGMCLSGCSPAPVYYGKSTVERIDGKVTSVKVVLPRVGGEQMSATYQLSDRESLDKLIQGLDSLLLDLKMARDQMPVIEPKEPKR